MTTRRWEVSILVRIGNIHPRAAGVGAGRSRTEGRRWVIGNAGGVQRAGDMLRETMARLPLC